LIHGLDGTSSPVFTAIDGTTSAEKNYFANLIEYFYTSDLKDSYKLYRFHYLSNQVTVQEIAQGLREWLDDYIQQEKIDDVSLVIIAHSMGGLVSRSFLEEQTHMAGRYAGQLCGERVLLLLTLATPHHGSQAANDQARQAGSEEWDILAQSVDVTYWQGVTVTEPSRSDLRWDNYNNLPGYGADGELNEWLARLNENGRYTNKVVGYYGGIENESYLLKELWDYLNTKGADYVAGLYVLGELTGVLPATENILLPYKGPYDEDIPFDEHVELCFAGVLLKKFYGVENDGLVPLDSGRLEGLSPQKILKFEGFDHEDMKSDRAGVATLFTAMKSELDRIAVESGEGTGCYPIHFTGMGNDLVRPAQVGDSATFTASAINTDQGEIYYRFDLIPNYGTEDYDPMNNWQPLEDFSIDSSCTHTFTEAGGYVVVVWASSTSSIPIGAAPIIGCSVTVGGVGPVVITGLEMNLSGALEVGDSVTFTAAATDPDAEEIYYRFDLIPNYGTNDYDPLENYQTIKDFSTASTCEYTFSESGNYVIVVWASEAASMPENAPPIIGGSVAVKNRGYNAGN
jgi:hypothetical protein